MKELKKFYASRYVAEASSLQLGRDSYGYKTVVGRGSRRDKKSVENESIASVLTTRRARVRILATSMKTMCLAVVRCSYSHSTDQAFEAGLLFIVSRGWSRER